MFTPLCPAYGDLIDQRGIDDPCDGAAHIGTGNSVIRGIRAPVVLVGGRLNAVVVGVQIHAADKSLEVVGEVVVNAENFLPNRPGLRIYNLIVVTVEGLES